MNKSEIEIGGTYLAKSGGKSVEVRIESAIARGGWNATNLDTGRPLRVKDARDLKPVKRKAEKAAVVAADDTTAANTPISAPDAPEHAVRPAGDQPAGEVADAGAVPVTTAPAAADSMDKAAKKPARKTKADAKPEKGMSCLDAAEEVLRAERRPLKCATMIQIMDERNLWTTTAATPAATLFSALLREIVKKGSASRFRKSDRGLFELNANG